DLEFAQGRSVRRGADAFVQHQAHVHVGDVVCRQQSGGAEFDLGGAGQVGIRVGNFAAAIGGDRAIEHLPVQVEADFLNLAALAFAQQFAGAANLQIVGGQGEAGAEIVQRGQRIDAFFRVR